jgi:hemolysin III
MSDIPASSHGPVEEKFSLPLFIATVAGCLVAILGVLWLVAPDEVWATQWSAPWWAFVGAFLVITLFNAFVEYFFHRYILHKPVVPFLSRFYRQHTLHHSLTRITRRRTASGRELPYVENIYPITEPEQHEASFFPWFTLPVFALVVTPLLALLTWAFPVFPWFVAGYAALAASLTLYEVFHAIEHWSFEKWAPLVENRYFGWMWRHIYSFHLRHHAVIDCNEGISGFFTFPVADLVFRTWVNPKTLYVDGGGWEPEDFHSPKPIAPIRWLDTWTDQRVKARRARARE